jgi:LacI family transcriptional regulator
LPSDAALAELANVSRATAHRALAEVQRMGLITRQRRWGTVVAPREKVQTGQVALILDQVAFQRDFPRADLIGGIHAGLGETRNLLWCDSKLSVDREIEFLRRMAVEADGILCWLTGNPKTTPVLRELVSRKVPIVLLDRVPDGLAIDGVTSNSMEASRKALNLLIERGHRRIAFFSFNKPHVSTVEERVTAFRTVHDELGWSSEGLTRLFPPEMEFGDSRVFLQVIKDALFSLVRGPEPITAAFCVQDMFASALLTCAESLGISIPGELEIASYNDWPAMMLQYPWQVHRIVTKAHDIGLAAAERLQSLMNGDLTGEPEVIRIPADLVVAQGGLLTEFHPSAHQGH